jgi:hypothetical protein
MSFSMVLSMPGRMTLTTTSRPSRVRALCTWATDAEAMGSRSKRSKSSSTGAPRAPSICAHGSFGARKRRHLVLQLRQLVGDVLGQQVAARRQHLAELDEHGPEFFQGTAQALAARRVGRTQAPGVGAAGRQGPDGVPVPAAVHRGGSGPRPARSRGSVTDGHGARLRAGSGASQRFHALAQALDAGGEAIAALAQGLYVA